MLRIPIEKFNLPVFDDSEVIMAWQWFMSFVSEQNWKKRKAEIEKKILMEFKSNRPFVQPLNEGTLLAVKDDVIGWYLYLIDVLINEPHKYEYFQGARIVPVFKRFGNDLETLKNISGIEKRVRDLLNKRRSEADAILFEMLTGLLWARNGYEVEFLKEKQSKKTPDIVAKKGDEEWYVECKRQSKTSDYAYRETDKRQKMISYVSKILIEKNILLDIVFHVELVSLPDSYLLDILEDKLKFPISGKIISNDQVDIDLSFVDIHSIRKHLKKYNVKNQSPMLNYLIGRRSIDNKSFTSGFLADFFRVGEGEINNLYVLDIISAFGVYCSCDAKEAILAKARDIKTQVKKAIDQFDDNIQAVVHIGMETFDGPEVESARFLKIKNTIERIDTNSTSLKWIFCHFFQSYSSPDSYWNFDETVNLISSDIYLSPPINSHFLIVPDDVDTVENCSHWERPLP